MDATRLLAAVTLLILSLTFGSEAKAQSESRFDSPSFPAEESARYADNRFANGPRTPRFDTRAIAPQSPQTQNLQSQFRPNRGQIEEPQISTQFHGEPNFLIPFDLEAHADSIGEVRLYASAQQGRDWRLHATQPPTSKEFRFQSGGDGEYWFAVRTTDRNRRMTAAAPVEPELKVIVDTQKPQLDLRVSADPSGKVMAEWLAEDPHLDGRSFRLLYLDQRGDWRQVNVRTPQQGDQRQRWQSSARWSLPTGLDQFELVAEVADAAKNVTRVRRQVSLTGGPNFAGSARSGGASQTNGAQNRSMTGSLNDFAAGVSRWLGGRQQADSRTRGARRQVNPVSTTTGVGQRRPVMQNPQGPIAQQRAGFDQRFPNGNGSSSNTNRFGSNSNQRPRITSSPNFEIDYQLQGIGQRGPRRVELWVTQDRGRSWELYGSDGDNQSPMEVRLTKEGLYGFRLLVHGFDSPPPKAPQNNEPADVWVAADWTRPSGRITRARLNDGANSGQYSNRTELIIDWIAEDALLEDQPITIQYGASSDGPWYPVATAIRNSGTYRWRLDRQLPETLFLQLQVRDVAGNVTTNVFDASGSQFGTPGATIIDIRPLGRSALVPVNSSNRL